MMKYDDDLIGGGQGRSGREVAISGTTAAVCLILGALLVLLSAVL